MNHVLRRLAVVVPVACAVAASSAWGSGAAPAWPLPSMANSQTTEIRVATFNLLGHSHTDGRHPMDGGRERMGRAVRILDTHRTGVVGFQEMQPPQIEEFLRLRARWWGLFPGRRLTDRDGANSIAWRKRNWELIRARTVAIPYFDGRERQMPLVKLRQKASGFEAWFFNTHNPVTNRKRGNQDRWRAEAVRRQIRMVNWVRSWSRRPLVLLGDYNDRERVFCPFGRQARLRAANGGYVTQRRCVLPPRPVLVDWIFGTREVDFHHYESLRTPYVRRTTDHPVVISRATVPLHPGVPR